MPSVRSRPISRIVPPWARLAALLVPVLVGAGCGGSDDDGDRSATSSPTVSPRPYLGTRHLLVQAKDGEWPLWRVMVTDAPERFCIVASVLEVDRPEPVCTDATTAAIWVSSEDGGVRATVLPIRSKAGGPKDYALVWGVALRDVKTITVRSGDRRERATLSRASFPLRPSRDALSQVEGVADVDDVVRVRTFGIAVPIDAADPPSELVTTPARPGAKPSVTLRLK